ncbi:helix-turn-helix transcriptional regulator [Streptomyces scabiei]|uniref:helix-turn-helix domain-containing protein n=4 Tax=Streptomyces scabiei TaxID=1930 RepID=UPI001B30570A|nr:MULTISPECIES: helix-turn-helix transcriptional regulator [Streptomyces]MBP5864078.1 helix-turn-helix domain-containing protein [Streptomyces sp. LBUM 1484]MBP5875298.1 helix-turn-helix domain-containing protein [Streptomyces sp. LBUM 1477]MBP5883057.1 helix-turn-helix domain-containing protein [Streptomyces sp. LBUM 1487]MBP5894063.1 helix-turn-helix domain-containing protein [Streptomyces sp. LBUM 1481]MBP5899139.1 helix-turn-helix domain-containing protein [Streptomyces sp. LBUM 1488]
MSELAVGSAEEESGAEGDERELGAGSGILRVFGRQLKRFRVRAGLERAEFGSVTGYSVSTIAAYEQGRRVPPPKFIDQADEVLDAGGVLQEMKEEVARAQFPAFFRDAARLEGEAVELHVYANQAVPGLLQTEEYAGAVFGMMRPPLDEDSIAERVAARLARQEVFAKRPEPLMSFVIDESVLRRPIGGRGVLRGQLEQILLAGQKRTVEIQVMPLGSEENAGLAGPFTLIETSEGRRIAYVEVQNVSHVHAERRLVKGLEVKYGILRAQALTPQASLTYVEKLLGEL